jgi:hypothetical protein
VECLWNHSCKEVRFQDSSSRRYPPLVGEGGGVKKEDDVRIEEFGRKS